MALANCAQRSSSGFRKVAISAFSPPGNAAPESVVSRHSARRTSAMASWFGVRAARCTASRQAASASPGLPDISSASACAISAWADSTSRFALSKAAADFFAASLASANWLPARRNSARASSTVPVNSGSGGPVASPRRLSARFRSPRAVITKLNLATAKVRARRPFVGRSSSTAFSAKPWAVSKSPADCARVARMRRTSPRSSRAPAS